ncbi:MAG: porin [Flavobacteriales bacterium]|nr:porin [Flavobacteriales bacterium]
MKKFTTVFLLMLSISLVGQEKQNKIIDALNSVVPYGTFEYALAGHKEGVSVVDIIPRFGLTGEWDFDNNGDYSFFTKAEFGLHLTDKNDFIKISPDPGASYGQESNAIFARQGYIGISSPFGSISIGKQWGVHYTLAGNIDNMYMFGGDAIGVYNAGTDGGASGAGRANQAVKYEFANDAFYIGLQGQFFALSTDSLGVRTDKKWLDAASIASYYSFGKIKVGASFTKGFGGILDPHHGEAILDDQLISLLIDFNNNNFHFGIIGSTFNQHEKDNTGIHFNGWGLEYNIKYNFGENKKWSFVNNSSIVMPFSDEENIYVSNRYAFELARRFSVNTVAILGFRYDNNTNTDGSKNGLHTLALGFYYNFNYPVP